MSTTKLMAATVAALLFLAACSKDENPNAPQGEPQRALKVTGGIQALTKAYDATWEANDAIGIYMFKTSSTTISEEAENRTYITPSANGNFTPLTTPTDQTIYFPIVGKTDFMAYYPWQSITKGANDNYFYAVNVANQSNQKAIDLMAADKVTDKDKEHTDVKFDFTHKLVKIVLSEITHGQGLTAADLLGLTVQLTNQHTQATYDVVNGGDVSVNTTASPTAIDLLVATDSRSAQAIILPASSTTGMELVFTLARGSVYTWALSNATNTTSLDAAHKYNYKITISKVGIAVTSSITDWVAGNGAGEEGTAQ